SGASRYDDTTDQPTRPTIAIVATNTPCSRFSLAIGVFRLPSRCVLLGLEAERHDAQVGVSQPRALLVRFDARVLQDERARRTLNRLEERRDRRGIAVDDQRHFGLLEERRLGPSARRARVRGGLARADVAHGVDALVDRRAADAPDDVER